MKRAVLTVALIASSSGLASAGGYVGLGIGTAPVVDSAEVDTYNADLEEGGRSGRLLGGYRFGRIAIEAAANKFTTQYVFDNDPRNPREYSMVQLQLSGKYILPLGDGFGAFGRLGVQKTWFNAEFGETVNYDVAGTGLVVGAGVEFRLPTVINASVFVDYQYGAAAVSGEKYDFGRTSTRMWTLGATIGF